MLILFGVFAVVVGAKRFTSARSKPGARRFLLLVALGVVLIALGAPRWLLLSKTIGLLLMPLGILWVTLAALALLAFWKERRRDCAVLFVLFVLLTAAGSTPLSYVLCRWAESPYGERAAHGRFDAVIVLGGGTDSRRGDVELGPSGDRVALGARLYHRGATPLVVTSGSPIEGLSAHDSVAATARIWRELGVPSDAIVTVRGALTTSDEARLHSRLIRERGWRRVGLVTSAIHMRRALGNFEQRDAHVVPLAADVRGRPFEWHGIFSLVPTAPGAQGIHAALWELLGRMAGR